jgi:ABC-type multidrug transport system permease subunit
MNSGWFPSSTLVELETLTVAGQWRNFTAFPSILTIVVIASVAGYSAEKLS